MATGAPLGRDAILARVVWLRFGLKPRLSRQGGSEVPRLQRGVGESLQQPPKRGRVGNQGVGNRLGGVRVKFTAFGLEVKHEKHPSDHRSVGRYLYAGNSADSQSHGPIQCSARTNAKSKRSPRECAGPYKSLRTRRRTDSLHNRTVCAPIAIGCHNWNCRFCWHGRRELA